MCGSPAPPGRCSRSGAARSSPWAAPAGESRTRTSPSAARSMPRSPPSPNAWPIAARHDGVQVNCIHPEPGRDRPAVAAHQRRDGAHRLAGRQKCREEYLPRDFGITPLRQGRGRGRSRHLHSSPRAPTWLHGATIDLDGGEIPVLADGRHEHPPHPRAHRAGRNQKPHRHAADDHAHGGRGGLRHRRLGRLLHGAGARRHGPHHRRDGLAGKMRPASPPRSRHLRRSFPARADAARRARSIAAAPRRRSSSAMAAATPAPTFAARRRSRRRPFRIRSTRPRSRPSCRRR